MSNIRYGLLLLIACLAVWLPQIHYLLRHNEAQPDQFRHLAEPTSKSSSFSKR